MTQTTSIYPVLMVESPADCAAFFVLNFQFETTFATDWYVSLKMAIMSLLFLITIMNQSQLVHANPLAQS